MEKEQGDHKAPSADACEESLIIIVDCMRMHVCEGEQLKQRKRKAQYGDSGSYQFTDYST